MRLFIAINFEEQIKTAIQDIVTIFKTSSIQGKFVNKEHMHLTLEFLGEVTSDKVEKIKGAMDQISTKPFSLQLTGVGFFKRREGNIYWIGIEESSELLKTKSQLHNILTQEGFELESREYKPHLTIGRKVLMDDSFNSAELLGSIEQLIMNIDKIDLMKSEQINGRLTHSIIYTKFT